MERVEKQIERPHWPSSKYLKPTQFGGVEKRNSYVHYKLLSTHTVSQHFNHSCHPNCAVSNTVDEACSILYFGADIRYWEELTINYAGLILQLGCPLIFDEAFLGNSLVSNATACDAKMRRKYQS